ncbi:MAG: pyridoxal phosphate-dependent aminotransferase [Chloroflexota bacterium]
MNEKISIPGFRRVPRTGVIYVMSRASDRGFHYDNPAWANLGQGAPETGPIPGAPPRVESVSMNPSNHEYGPVMGQLELRQKVADLYNELYRKGKRSQYTYENVSIAGGGRVALTRLAAALGQINMGHFLPDYTAYEELLSVFKAFTSIPILLEPDNLASNPCNPTGQLVEGDELQRWVQLARRYRCSLILDEFYSHFIYTGNAEDGPKLVSAAAYVEDVNSDPVILVDGLTKGWRYPGWRISWTVGPKEVITAIASAGSFLDGGANNPFQPEVLGLLDADCVMQDAAALQAHFRAKRNYMLERLYQMGITVEAEPAGTFYVWANLALLPEPINDGMHFFKEGLEENVITVPGVFFDVNPERRRTSARYRNYCRVSFGPEMEALERGLDSIERVIEKHS